MQTISTNHTIQENMQVLDINGKPVGKVYFYFPGKQKVDLDVVGLRALKTEMQAMMRNKSDFPLAVYSRFYRDGFVSIQLGHHAVYFIPQQIHVVVGNSIHLRVAREDLHTAQVH